MENVVGWLVFIWSVFSQPELMGGSGAAPWLIGGILVVVAITAAFMFTLGRRIARRSRILAVLAGGLFLPLIIIALAYAWVAFAPANDGHGGAMAAMMVLIIGIWTAPVSFITSLACVLWPRKAPSQVAEAAP